MGNEYWSKRVAVHVGLGGNCRSGVALVMCH